MEISLSSTVHEGQYDNKYLVCTRNIRIDGASGICGGAKFRCLYLEPARINEETETRKIEREQSGSTDLQGFFLPQYLLTRGE